jgi:flagellar L-ring protein precursor FlgH
MRLRVLALLTLLPLGACAGVQEAVIGPGLTPVAYPAPLAAVPNTMPLASVREPLPQPASANSLWRTGARTFFTDQRAARVGDILTVNIDIDDSAKTTNATSSSRTSGMKAGVPHFFGLETTLGKILPGAFDPTQTIETNSNQSNAGAGAVNRSEKISLTIAAVVTGILPNGNLIIQGTQEVRTNTDVRQLTVAGVVRPEDISAANTIRHTQIAEARISYSGRGDISRVQKTPMGQSLVEKAQIF